MDEGDEWLLLAFLSQILDQPFYAELRTNQQLGYIVQAGIMEKEGVRGLVFSVQSKVLPPPLVEERIDAFLVSLRAMLVSMPEAKLSEFRDALARQAVDIDRRLGAQTSRLWSEIQRRRYDYARPWRTAARAPKVSREQLLDFYDRHLDPVAPTHRRLATHVFAKAGAPPTLIANTLADDFFPAPPDRAASLDRATVEG